MDWIAFFAPMTAGLVMSRVCPNVGQTRAPIKAQPPGWVFGVVWPLLYLSIGLAWMLSRKVGNYARTADIIFVTNMICINAWIWFYGCKKQKDVALWTFIPSIATALIALIFVYHVTSAKHGWWPAALLAPYIAWLMFASQLSFANV